MTGQATTVAVDGAIRGAALRIDLGDRLAQGDACRSQRYRGNDLVRLDVLFDHPRPNLPRCGLCDW